MIDNGWGRIINITTSLDTMYRFGLGAYGPTKAALEAHTHIMAHDLEGTGVTANVLIPGGPVSTRMFPEDAGAPRELLLKPDILRKPIVWLCSEESDGVNSMRFRGALWDDATGGASFVEKGGAPVAWRARSTSGPASPASRGNGPSWPRPAPCWPTPGTRPKWSSRGCRDARCG